MVDAVWLYLWLVHTNNHCICAWMHGAPVVSAGTASLSNNRLPQTCLASLTFQASTKSIKVLLSSGISSGDTLPSSGFEHASDVAAATS